MNFTELIENNDSFRYLKTYYDDERFIKSCVGSHELKHSNILNWIFNSESNHNLKYFPIRRLLKYFNIEADNLFIKKVTTMREQYHIDLLIRVQFEDHNLAIIIENKLNAKLSEEQLPNYRKVIEKNYPNDELLCIYLHPTSNNEIEKAKESGFKSLTYQELYEAVLQPMLALSIDNDATIYLRDYIYTLSTTPLDDGSFAIIATKEKECLKNLLEKSNFMHSIIDSVKSGVSDEYNKYYRNNKTLFITIFNKYLSIPEESRNPKITQEVKEVLNTKCYILNDKPFKKISELLMYMFTQLLKEHTLDELQDFNNIFRNPLLVEENERINTANPKYFQNDKYIIPYNEKKYYLLSSWDYHDYEILKREFNRLKETNSIYEKYTLE